MAALESNQHRRAVACVGPKGCYKSALACEVARQYGKDVELFSLHSDMTARDLVLTRGTTSSSTDTSRHYDGGDTDGGGGGGRRTVTVWNSTPLTRAVKQGTWVILDGFDKIGTDTLSSLALLMNGIGITFYFQKDSHGAYLVHGIM